MINEKDAYTVTTLLSINNVTTSSPSSTAISRVARDIYIESIKEPVSSISCKLN